MFRGINEINLDEKGRLAIPKAYRDTIHSTCSGKLIVTIDTEYTCLLLYPLHEWETIEKKLRDLPTFDQRARRIQHLLIGHACDVDMDAQGRILLSKALREHAGLEKNIFMIGQCNKLEIWSKEQWQANCDRWLEQEAGEQKDLPEPLKALSL